MLKKYISVIVAALVSQSCNAEIKIESPIEFSIGNGAKSFFSFRYYDAPQITKKEDIINLYSLKWFEEYEVKDSSGAMKKLESCDEFVKSHESYSESIISEYSTFRYYLMHCLAIKKVIDSKDSKKSFLPKQIVSKDSPSILPKEFIPVVAKSYQEVVDSMPPSARWKDGIKVISTEDLGNNRIKYTQEVQTQILSELARADFNGDGLEDSLVYLRTTMNGGSWESDQIITLTAGEDGVIKTLDVYPKE